jgi:hypothetical protein
MGQSLLSTYPPAGNRQAYKNNPPDGRFVGGGTHFSRAVGLRRWQRRSTKRKFSQNQSPER